MRLLAARPFVVLTGIFIATTTLAETNLSGRWDVMMDPDFAGNPSIEHCQMKQDNRKLTVKCGNTGAAMSGEVNGQNVSWKFVSTNGSSAAWSGVLDESAATVKGTWVFTFDDGDKMRGRFTAQKRPD
jgi:hypothetical protein